jgi:hypothetical protein
LIPVGPTTSFALSDFLAEAVAAVPSD